MLTLFLGNVIEVALYEWRAWRSGESTRLRPMRPDFDSRTRRGLSLLLVLVLVLNVFLRVLQFSSR